jgi:outer membrane receptor for ferrienterochelin and colicin
MLSLWFIAIVAAPVSQPSSVPASVGRAEESPDIFEVMEEQNLEEMFGIFEEQDRASVTVASARATNLREAPGSVWLIDQARLRDTAAIDLYDVLRTVPGMTPIERSLSQADANMRLNISVPDLQTLVVLDGRVVTADSTSFYDRKLLNLQDIERVEVVNGPSSTLYGANAFLGVVSITRRAPRRDGFHAQGDGDAGFAVGSTTLVGAPQQVLPLGWGYASAEYGWKTGGIRVSGGGKRLPSFGYGTDSGLFITQPSEQANALVDFSQDLTKNWELRTQFDFAFKSSLYEIADGNYQRQQDYAVNTTIKGKALAAADDQLTINAWVRHFVLDFAPEISGVPLTYVNLRTTAFELRSLYALPKFANNALTVGFQVRGSVNDSAALADIGKQQLLAGLFAEDTWHPIQPLVITAGLRADIRESLRETAFKYFSFSPRASIAWLISDNHTLRVDYGAAFRSPTATERSATLTASDGTTYFYGNPDLKNEQVHSVTLGYIGRINWFTLRLEAYIMQTRFNISPHLEPWASDVFETPTGQPLFRPEGGRFKLPFYVNNLDEFWIPGALASFEIKPFDNWRMWAHYTFVPIDSQHQVALGSELHIWRLSWSAQIYWRDQYQDDPVRPVDLPARFTVNTRVAMALDQQGHWKIALSGINLIDVRFFYFRTPGKGLRTGDAYTGERVGPRVWASLEASY